MKLGLRIGLLVTAAGALAGCLTSNPNLEESESSDGEGSTASTEPTSGAVTTEPTTGPTTTADPTSDGPTTLDPDTTDTEPTDPTSDTDETSGPASCGDGNVCAQEAPAGWAGPVVWAETLTTDETPECPAAYPDLAFEAFDDLQAAPAECDCECGAASDVSCASISLEYHGTDSSCLTSEDEFLVSATGACNAGPNVGSSSRRWEAPQPGVTGGDCTPSATSMVPVASWSAASTLCGGVTPSEGSCEPSEVCVARPPETFEGRLCVWQAGALECPDGAYADRFLRHASIDDDRNCATCTCGDPEGDCNGNVILRPSNNCSGATGSGSVPLGGGCVLSADDVHSVEAGALSVSNVSCEPSVGTAIGEAEPDDPYTLCCLTVE
ncbi:MAG: hypothetical protein ACRBN8_11990 [Nannocystales bacterium]